MTDFVEERMSTAPAADSAPVTEAPSAVIRFAGDSGDGMQLAGGHFTDTSAVFGNDVATLPDFPAEIRAPAGTVAGVSGFQVHFASTDIHTAGDKVDALIAMNPAALKAHLADVEPGGLVVANTTEFTKPNFKKADIDPNANPLDDPDLAQRYKLIAVPIGELNAEATKGSGLNPRDAGRCKNMFALGLAYWLFERPIEHTAARLENYFGVKKKRPDIAEANLRALRAGYDFGETAELFPLRKRVAPAKIAPGKYRKITGNEALAMGLIAAGQLADRKVVYCSYPITPASDILHYLAPQKRFGVRTFQAEDEIAAVCAAIGAGFAGELGVTGTSGPGLALKSEAIGLGVITELPLVVVNVQRGGPSTGLPTKTEQSDLLQAMYGRNGDCPAVVIAPKSPADCFHAAIEACTIALQRRVPVLLLSDGYLANGSEPWKLVEAKDLAPIDVDQLPAPDNGEVFEPYSRDDKGVRPWAVPGTPGRMHRVGGLEKQHGTGNVSYDAENHQRMTDLRAAKVAKIADDLPATQVEGPDSGDLLLLGWGGPYGSCRAAAEDARARGLSVSHVHLRYINPMPNDLGDVLKRFKQVLIPELNTGQLRMLIRSKYLVDAQGLNKVQGKPFRVSELRAKIDEMLGVSVGS
ncbi:MAG: 2-oxoacid:acceptor oxidoreductase subunit alpha [Planctomycetota bacterium]